MRRFERFVATASLAILAILACAIPARAAEDGAAVTLQVADLGGWAMSPDNRTLIVAATSAGELVYFDTVADKELKHVEVEFQPTSLAAQGKTLVAAAKGSSQLHVLDLETGKEQSTIDLAGSGFVSLACHPSKGYVYAAAQDGYIYAVDVQAGKGWKTKGVGTMLAVDPVHGDAVYAATQRAIRENLVIQQVGSQTQVRIMQSGQYAVLLKFKVAGKGLVLESGNSRSAINAHAIAVSADGKKVAIAGGGGIDSPVDHKRSYAVPVYSAANLENMVGQIDTGPYPNNVAFHPVLNLGAAENAMGDALVFKSTSLVTAQTLKVPASHVGPTLLAFGGEGTKLIYGVGAGGPGAPKGTPAKLEFIPLQLTEQQKSELKKAYAGTGSR